MLHLLEALQLLQIKMPGGGQAEARRLSFRALDIEQIGHVYEGLLDHTAKRATEPYLGLVGTRDKEPEIALAALERVAGDGWWVEGEEPNPSAAFLSFLKEQTGRSESALRKALASPATRHEPLATQRLRTVCQGDDSLWKRVQPLAGVVRPDSFGYPVVIPEGSVFVTSGTDRRSSGTHYTPRSLTEPIVQYTLEPLVYHGPAEGLPKSEWKLKPAKELLALKICDMACGSGAFLVQACRYLAERVLEAWEAARQANPDCPGITPEGLPSAGSANEELIPDDPAERKLYAMRLVAQRCLYGVDKNPLAVEMAKLSLWLLTMAKDKPFEFLDHNIRSGDSLVGLHNIDQLRHFSLKPDANDAVLFKGPLDEAVDEAINLRLKLEDLPANSVEDVQRQEKLLIEANEKIARLRCAADLLVSAEFWGESAKDKLERVRHASNQSVLYFEKGPTEEFERVADKERRGQSMFHWPLEFPEVIVKRGGFDAFVGNPPFMHGSWISSRFGNDYASFLRTSFTDIVGKIDYVVYFLRQAARLVCSNGAFGLILSSKTNEGDGRKVGFQALVEQGYSIYASSSNIPWPGQASILICTAHIFRGLWRGASLNSHLVSDDDMVGTPYSLSANNELVFVGAWPGSLGFVLTESEIHELLNVAKNKQVIRPFYTGSDLNALPTLIAPRMIVDFSDCTVEQAISFTHIWKIVEDRVKPDKSHIKRKVYRENWWKFCEPQSLLFRLIRSSEWAIAVSRVSKHFVMRLVPTDAVYSDKVVVFARHTFSDYAILSSDFHSSWAVSQATTHGSGTPEYKSYKPSECGRTFPFPQSNATSQLLDGVGRRVQESQDELYRQSGSGPTGVYNRFHDPEESSSVIQKLRDLHVEMDQAVAAAYGWTDLKLGHGFHETKQGVRFTISEPARREVLQRLLKLNHERYAEEVKQGLHDRKGGGARGEGPGKKKAAPKADRKKGGALFDLEGGDE